MLEENKEEDHSILMYEERVSLLIEQTLILLKVPWEDLKEEIKTSTEEGI